VIDSLFDLVVFCELNASFAGGAQLGRFVGCCSSCCRHVCSEHRRLSREVDSRQISRHAAQSQVRTCVCVVPILVWIEFICCFCFCKKRKVLFDSDVI
jgi:hypothetical protein